MKRTLLVLVALLLLAGVMVGPASSATETVRYTVKIGDTLGDIAARHCTTWQQIYALNRAVIGSNPDIVIPGTVLQVPNNCGGTLPPPGSVYDRGPTLHARGTVKGNIYTVALGDTAFSISARFGLTLNQLAAANGIRDTSKIYADQKLVIPGLGPGPQPGKPFITISSPSPGSTLPPTFTASGTGGGLFEGGLVVRAQDAAGKVLAQQPTILKGADVGGGGSGTWSVQLTVTVAQPTKGSIVAFAESPSGSGTQASASVQVVFSSSVAVKPFITISKPTPGSILPPTFTASGTGGGLFEGALVVRAQDATGKVLVQQPTTLQGTDVGTGGSGTWSVSLSVNVTNSTQGSIVAFADSPSGSGTLASASVPVVFGLPDLPYKVYMPGQCKIQGKPNAPLYVYPDGPQAGHFGAGGTFNATRGAKASGQYWYEIVPQASAGNPPVWAPVSSTTSVSPGCAW
jgi:LysM repeat protein